MNKTFAVEIKHKPGGKQLANRLLNRGGVEQTKTLKKYLPSSHGSPVAHLCYSYLYPVLLQGQMQES